MSKDIRIVNIKTGEDLSDDYTLRNRKQDEAYRKAKQLEDYKSRNVGRRHVRCYHEPIKEILETLKLHELGALIKLIPYMKFNKDGLLTKDATPMTIDIMADIFGKSKRASQTVVNALVREGVLEKVKPKKTINYRVTERYHEMGEVTQDGYYTKLYQVESRKVLERLTIQEAGLLYKILPYFHFENYYLCANPNEHEPSEIKHLNHNDLSLLIGEEVQTVYNNMKALIRNGVIMKVSAYGAVNYLVNPDVMFRKEIENEYTDHVRNQFRELQKTGEGLH